MTVPAVSAPVDSPRSVFTAADVCEQACLPLPPETRRPVFDDDTWDFTEVIGLPVQLRLAYRRFNFAAILESRWRLTAKELILALLAPRHEAVALLPRALRTPLHLHTCYQRLAELTRWLNWLTNQGVTSLADVDVTWCEAYLAHRRHIRDENGVVVGDRSPAVRRGAAQTIADLLNYRELFSTDRVRADLRPWSGASPSAVAEMRSGRDGNTTLPLDDRVLQPLLASALFLVTVLGPHAVELTGQLREAERWKRQRDGRSRFPASRKGIVEVLTEYAQAGEPLPLVADHIVAEHINANWPAEDPLTPLALDTLARQAGFVQFDPKWIPDLRDKIEKTLTLVGAEKPFGRNAIQIQRADDAGTTAWTLPLHRMEARALVGVVRTATIITIGAITGMRSSELMELEVGCRRPPQESSPGLLRYRLVSRIMKGQPLGGTEDEWVVIEPVHQAAGLAEQLHDNPRDGAPLFGRFAFDVRYKWFRNWVNGPAGQHLGLAPIPEEDKVTLRAMRRTLALGLAYRPGGLLAAKIHLKHISVATTEGYSSRPGGAQGELLAEVNKHEAQRNLDLVLAEFRNYQQGVLPAGPGARDLTAFFASVDAQLDRTTTDAPKVQQSDREVLNLLTKRAGALHLGHANYCWFTDPSRALCLKLAGTPHADKPLAGMCDSARCPQATHHPCHRTVWAEHAEQAKSFLGSLGPTRRAERTRLQTDYDRALRVLDAIDTAANPSTEE
jgi:hypothetical protein